MAVYRSRLKSQSWAGETIGILVLDCFYPYIPGNVANATTYKFPVRYSVVDGATSDRLVFDSDPALFDPYIKAAQRLEADGVKAITGACGFMALFQKRLRAAVNIPVFASSLLQIPFIHQITGRRVGIISADSRMLKRAHFDGVGVSEDIPIALTGMENSPAFTKAIFPGDGTWDDDPIRAEVVQVAQDLAARHPDIGAILFECSDLPPYAADVQAATGLPVFDFITMINYVHETLARKPYTGVL